MAAFGPSDTLKSRSFIGLIISQFLAAFNDQASHIVAIFYASDMLVHYAAVPHVHEKDIITAVTACFITPFFLFSPLAGMLADKYSKRSTLLCWKLAEVAIMGLGLVGFLLPHLAGLGWAEPRTLAVWSALLVVSVVFLMGTHSAFFVPAKYGIMPEILQPAVLSKGNGYLEGTSFVAQLIGTAFGGFLYGTLKSDVLSGPAGSVLHPGSEWVIGLVLLGLAVAGTAGSLLIGRVAAAAPDRPLTWKLWQPLQTNIGVLLRSRPLALSVLGIAFFLFMTLFLRQTLLYDGEIAKELQKKQLQEASDRRHPQAEEEQPDELLPSAELSTKRQHTEFKIALLIALVGLGVGIGSPLAGYLSGNKVELGLVPIGATFLALITAVLAGLNLFLPVTAPTQRTAAMVVCLVLSGMAASLYIVPLYTLLQHRAPKDSKGNLVATSNFINVLVGGLLAVGVFYVLTLVLDGVFFDFGPNPQKYQLETKLQMAPAALFLTASLLTVGMLVVLCRQLPDFFVRSLLWLDSHGRYRLRVIGINNLPSDGPVILATNCDRFESCMQVTAATDRFTLFILLESPAEPAQPQRPLLRFLARRTGLVPLRARAVTAQDREQALARAATTLQAGNLLGLTVDGGWPAAEADRFLDDLRGRQPAVLLPVYCGAVVSDPAASQVRRVRVVIGQPLRPQTTAEDVRQTIRALGAWVDQADHLGLTPVSVMPAAASGTWPTAPEPDRPRTP
ncbi:MAG TPA: MFS transporter [Gemmataceae bacterium]|jgi:acyl-[acyl-carrier-protein]-phospholipid O-acyltransferase/long-chain-fatty-acid--[acyl-carrier-protein] ligase|nr:MFS transporter [Gemmataceae bacterium]